VLRSDRVIDAKSPLPTAVGPHYAHSGGHVQPEVNPLEQPGQGGSVPKVDIPHLHDRGTDDAHLGWDGIAREEGEVREGMHSIVLYSEMQVSLLH
jgi:hypothetical protein